MTRRRPVAVLTPELLGCDVPSAETTQPRSEFVEAIPWLVGEELSQLRTCLHEVWAVQQAGESLDCEAVRDLLALLRRACRRIESGVLSQELLSHLRYGNTLARVDALLLKMQGREDGPTPDEVDELDGLLAGPREQLARLRQQQECQPPARTQTRVRIRREDE